MIVTDLGLPRETANKIGAAGHAFQLDVTQEDDWRSVAAKSRELGEVDIVINNAGYFPNRSIDQLDFLTWRKTIATNLDSHFLSAKYFLPTMRRKQWGRIVRHIVEYGGLGHSRHEPLHRFQDGNYWVHERFGE